MNIDPGQWAAREAFALLRHMREHHDGELDLECGKCMELVIAGEASVERIHAHAEQRLQSIIESLTPVRSQTIDIYMGASDEPRIAGVTVPPGALVAQVPCHECLGTGWWGFGPVEETNGPCVDCKGTGREWVGLA